MKAWPPLPLHPMVGWELAYADARAETEVGGTTPVLLRRLAGALALRGQVSKGKGWSVRLLARGYRAPLPCF